MRSSSLDPAVGDLIALYGSLMSGLRGAGPFDLAHRLRYVGPCLIEGQLFDLGEYPGLIQARGRVVGELYAVLDPIVLQTLDRFEDFDPARPDESIYLRKRVELIEPAATSAWLYVYNRPTDSRQRVPNGDWRRTLEARTKSTSA